MNLSRFTLAPLEQGEADGLASPLFRTGPRFSHLTMSFIKKTV